MHCAVSLIPPAHVIRIAGRWDAFSAPEFEAFWNELSRAENPRLLVLDLTDVDYVSSFGLRGLLLLGKQLEPLGGALHIAGMCPAVHKVFLGSGLASLFPAFADAVAAAAAFARGQ